MPTIEGIAFDLEGTVVDVEFAHHRAFLMVCAEIGHPMTFDQALERVPGFIGGGDNIISAKLHELPCVTQTAEELRARKMEHYERLLKEIVIRPRPGFAEAFAEIRRLGLPTAIGSLTTTDQAMTLLDRSGVGKLFGGDNIVLKEHVRHVKPASDVFLETARRMGVEPANQIVFEDSPRGVRAAVAAGSRAIGMPVYTMPRAQHELIDAGVSRIFWDWREIAINALLENLNSG